MLRQTQTSPAVRLRAQASRMGKRTATTQSGAASAMGPAIRQEIYTNLARSEIGCCPFQPNTATALRPLLAQTHVADMPSVFLAAAGMPKRWM